MRRGMLNRGNTMRFKCIICMSHVLACSIVTVSAKAEGVSDKDLLLQICDAKHISSSECKVVRNYPEADSDKSCNLALTDGRYEGKFVSSKQTHLLINYTSDCESHANNFGGSILYERIVDGYRFVKIVPGVVLTACIALPKSTDRDRLVCTASFMGQGYLEFKCFGNCIHFRF